MSTLGFEEYVEPLKVYLHKYRETEGEKATNAKGGGDATPKKETGGAQDPGAPGNLGGNSAGYGQGQIF